MIKQTFAEFKETFYSKIDDLSILDCGDFNALKIVLDGLKVKYLERGRFRTYIFYPFWIYQIFLLVKRVIINLNWQQKDFKLWSKAISNYANRKIILNSDEEIIYKDGEKEIYNKFYYCIKENLPGNTFYSAVDKFNKKLYSDIIIGKHSNQILVFPFSKEEKELIFQIKKILKQLIISRKFEKDEISNIKMAFQHFFNQYRLWNYVLKILNPRVCIFRCHYHKEGMILALKRKGITTIEFQHGLIAKEDIFYMFPPVVKPIKDKCLFADRIWVYGKFWKERLLHGNEYDAHQIDIIGYYPDLYYEVNKGNTEMLSKITAGKQVIMIATQTFLHQYFIEYVQWLARDIENRQLNCIIIVKPHPAEDINLYKGLKELNGVYVIQDNIDFMLKYSHFVVSIYSTVLYDALRYNIPSYSIYVDICKDYIHTFVNSGISQLLHNNQNPVDLPKHSNKFIPSDFFDTLNTKLIQQLLN